MGLDLTYSDEASAGANDSTFVTDSKSGTANFVTPL